MQYKCWTVNPPHKSLAAELAEECNVDPFIALIAAGRGYTDPYELSELISPDILMNDPFELCDMEKAVDIISDSIYSEELIAVFGDYDVDGVTATALLYSYLKNRGARVIYAVPDREKDGYGINISAIDKFHSQNVDLIITVDNGISAISEIDYAKRLGMKVVVTDHHLPGDELPEADAVIDPHRADDFSDFREICGVMVAFKLISALEGKSPEEMLYEYGDLVTIGTVADVMPLIYENRSAVRAGIEVIKEGKRRGISALLKASGIEPYTLTASKIAYSIAPRLNAAGRMGDAARAIELLLTDDDEAANGLSELLCNENIRRQSLEKKIFAEAVESVEKSGYKHNRVIVVEGEGWHHGVVGIVAARIAEKYGRPAVVLSVSDGVANGSARSIKNFSIYDAIADCSYLLSKFGGHEMAAGVTLSASMIGEFRRAINEYAANLDRVFPEVRLDCKLNPSALSLDLVEELRTLEPFGVGNPVPVFGIYGARLEKVSPVASGKHLRLGFSKNDLSFTAMLFGTTPQEFSFEVGQMLDIAVTVDSNEYNGTTSLTVHIKEMRKASDNFEQILIDMDEYESFKSGLSGDYSELVPTREETAAVYKEVIHTAMPLEKLMNRLQNTVSPAKVLVSAEALCELRVCSLYSNEGVPTLKIANSGQKVNLDDAAILKKLKERG